MNKTYPVYKHPAFTGLIGVAQSDITPPAGIYSRNWGAANTDVATGVHQPLILGCVTFQSAKNEQPLVLVTADLGLWKRMDDEQYCRQGILDVLGLDAARLMFCFSHTHAGPSLCRDDVNKSGGQHIEPYLLQLQQKVIDTARKALANAALSTLTWHYGTCNLATNRDLPEIGKDRIVVGFNPDNTADNTLLVGRITDENNQVTGTIVNYACHPTTLAWDNPLISPDWVGAMRDLVQQETQAPCFFLQGTSGELAPAEQYSGDKHLAERHGKQVGFAVLATLQDMLSPGKELKFDAVVESGAALAVWRESDKSTSTMLSARMVNAPLPLKELKSIAEIKVMWEECNDRVLEERLWRKLNVRKAVGDGDTAAIPLWVWQIGDSFLAGQPNEAYSLFQRSLRKQFPDYAVAVMNVANGHIGYLPTKDMYDKDIYSVWQTPFAEGALEKLIETATETIESIRTEK